MKTFVNQIMSLTYAAAPFRNDFRVILAKTIYMPPLFYYNEKHRILCPETAERPTVLYRPIGHCHKNITERI